MGWAHLFLLRAVRMLVMVKTPYTSSLGASNQDPIYNPLLDPFLRSFHQGLCGNTISTNTKMPQKRMYLQASHSTASRPPVPTCMHLVPRQAGSSLLDNLSTFQAFGRLPRAAEVVCPGKSDEGHDATSETARKDAEIASKQIVQ